MLADGAPRQCPRQPPFRATQALAVLGFLVPAVLAAGLCGDNEPAKPVPECVSSSTGVATSCAAADAIRLWPESGLRPGLPGQQLPGQRDSTQWRSFSPPAAHTGHELFLSLDIEDEFLYVAYNVGLQVWNISGGNAESPRRRRFADLYGGGFMTFISDGENDFWIDDISAINPTGDGDVDVLIALTGKDGVGFSVWEHHKAFDSIEQHYQDPGTDTRTVETLQVGDSVFAFAGSNTGIHVYELMAARQLDEPCIDDQGSVCPGIYRGRVGTLELGYYVSVLEHDGQVYVAASTGGNAVDAKLEIWRVPDPATPETAVLLYRSTGRDNRGPELFTYRGQPYLAIVEPGQPSRKLSLYPVGACLDDDGCNALGTPSWQTSLPSWPTTFNWLTFSESGGRPFLYAGFQSTNMEGGSIEQLYDLATLGTTNQITELTAGGGAYLDPCSGQAVDYWGYYYPGNEHGLRNITSQAARIKDGYLYRAAFGVLDVHRLGEIPSEIFADGFESGDVTGWSTVMGLLP